MRKIIFLTFAIGMGFGGFTFADAYNPDLDLLKSYRTYIGVTKIEPVAHRLIATFMDLEPHQLGIAGNSADEIKNLPDKMFGGAYGFVPPADKTKPVPKQLKELAEAAAKRIKEVHPNARDIQFSYQGRYGRVHVHDVIPGGKIADGPFNRPALKSNLVYRYFPELQKLEPDFSIVFESYFNGFTHLAFEELEGQSEENTKWLPIVLSPSIEGFSILQGYESENPIYQAEHERYLNILKQTIARMEAGTYTNPIREIVARQGDGLFPKLYHGYGQIPVSIYGRKKIISEQQLFDFEIEFPVAESLGGKVSEGIHEDSQVGVRIKWQINLEAKELKTQFYQMTADGEKLIQEAVYDIDTNIVQEGKYANVSFGSLSLRGADPAKGERISLPGNNEYTSIDIYIRELAPNFKTKPEGSHPVPAPEIPLLKNNTPRPSFADHLRNFCGRLLRGIRK